MYFFPYFCFFLFVLQSLFAYGFLFFFSHTLLKTLFIFTDYAIRTLHSLSQMY